MALSLDFNTPFGTASYHRVEVSKTVYGAEPEVKGAAGSVYASIRSYKDRETRDAGGVPFSSRKVRIRFGEDCDDVFHTKVAVYESPQLNEEGNMIVPVFDPATGKMVMVDTGKKPPESPKVIVMRTNEPTRADIYAAIKSMPEFADSVDA